MLTPAKVLPVSWHVAHGTPATGAWFIGVPAKLANAAAAWQLSHPAVPNGMCVPGGDTGVTPANDCPTAWQLEHPFTIPAWFIGAGFHACVEWQVSQARLVGMWDPGWAVARAPLWQVAQLPGVTPAWSNRTVVQLNVLWHESQEADVTRWPEGFPDAVVPLWQVAQVPGATPMWSNCALAKDSVLWQTEHSWVIGTCEDVITTVLMRAAAVWQPVQVFGVFLNSPRTWQLSQRVRSCAPVSGNPVVQCSATASGPGSVETRFDAARVDAAAACAGGFCATEFCADAPANGSAAPRARTTPTMRRRSEAPGDAQERNDFMGACRFLEKHRRRPIAARCVSRRP